MTKEKIEELAKELTEKGKLSEKEGKEGSSAKTLILSSNFVNRGTCYEQIYLRTAMSSYP